MAVISVEVPEFIAKKFSPYSVVQWKDLSMEEQLLEKDGEGWETIVDFGKQGVNAKEILSYLKTKIRIIFKKNGKEFEIINIDTRGDVYKGL